MEFNLADLFEAVADAVPDRTAVIAGDRRLTYRELDERANRVAHYLRDVGVVPGQHVGIYSFNRVEWAETMLGCFKARAVPINVNYRYVIEELRYLFDNADLVALFFESEFGPHVGAVLSGVPKLQHLVRLDDGTGTDNAVDAVDYEHALAVADPTRAGLLPRSPDDLYVLYTGGTTGMPKGVMW
ncbi:MAG: 3-oxocholest-4-en-26-oate---CoA ligase, partial [Actinomycetota bacterium]|nr:3-oxocholest-4-en-26-oate---CoA ligase [Actinomycetota bacterium]